MNFSYDINLLPVRRAKKSARIPLLPVLLTAAVIVGAPVGLDAWQRARMDALDRELAAVQDAMGPLLTAPREAAELREQLRELRAISDEAAAFRDTDLLLAHLRALADSLPAGVAPSSLTVSAEGIGVSGTADSDAILYRYIQNLEATGLFPPVTVVQVGPADAARRGFQLRFAVLSAAAEEAEVAP